MISPISLGASITGCLLTIAVVVACSQQLPSHASPTPPMWIAEPENALPAPPDPEAKRAAPGVWIDRDQALKDADGTLRWLRATMMMTKQ